MGKEGGIKVLKGAVGVPGTASNGHAPEHKSATYGGMARGVMT